MSFISSEFVVLFLIVLSLYYVSSLKIQNLVLLTASLIFYAWWDWRFLGLMLFSALTDYSGGLYLDKQSHPTTSATKRKLILGIVMGIDLGILAFFKYYGFFVQSMADLLGINPSGYLINIVLPLGISFYTFQAMSYAIDVYRGHMRAVHSIFDYLLFVSFFPQLVAGPIERAEKLLSQIQQPRVIRLNDFYSGAQLLFVGTFKKMVIADNLGPIVDKVFQNTAPGGIDILLAVYAFAFQILCDFSGYSDMARGMARMMGFDLSRNFHLPYFATNPQDFWRRWHITLSTWFRDYVYIPLGGNKGTFGRIAFRLMLTMFLAGLWHGAAWNYVLWGIYHGLLLVLFHWWQRQRLEVAAPETKELPILTLLKIIFFFQVTCVGWLLFRVKSVSQFLSFGSQLFDDWSLHVLSKGDVQLIAALVVPFIIFQAYRYVSNQVEPWIFWPAAARTLFYVVLFYAILLLGTPQRVPFIYFQF